MTMPFGAHDTNEGSDNGAQGLQLLQQELTRLANLEESGASEITALQGSLLEADDIAIEYTPMSYQLQFIAASAHDHLSTLGRLLTAPDGGLPAMAGYTLIRSGLEASAYGIWLLNGGTMNKRVIRALRLIQHNRRDVESLAVRLGTTDEAKNDRVRARLLEIKDRRGGLKQLSLDEFPSTTAIIEEADRQVAEASFSGIQVWKACSGMAHANQGAAVNMLERRQISAGDGVGATYFTTSSFLVVARMFQVAMNFYESFLSMASRHASTSPSGRNLA
jgi:hypothetical protein